MNRSPALFAATSLTFAMTSGLIAQGEQPARSFTQAVPAAPNAPILVAGSEFFILDPPAKPSKTESPKKRLPVIVVILFWVFAMFLWQVYFNRKARP